MPLTIGIITGVAGLAAGGFDMFQGRKKEKEAKQQMENLVRPMMGVPEAQTRAVDLAEEQYRKSQIMSVEDMPGYQAAIANLSGRNAANFANASKVSSSASDLLSVVTSGMESEQDKLLEFAMSNANYQGNQRQLALQRQANALAAYQAQLGGLANTQQQMFLTNQLGVYNQKYDQLSANMAAGQQQFAQGLGGIGSTIGNAAPMIGAGSGAQGWENMRAMYGYQG